MWAPHELCAGCAAAINQQSHAAGAPHACVTGLRGWAALVVLARRLLCLFLQLLCSCVSVPLLACPSWCGISRLDYYIHGTSTCVQVCVCCGITLAVHTGCVMMVMMVDGCEEADHTTDSGGVCGRVMVHCVMICRSLPVFTWVAALHACLVMCMMVSHVDLCLYRETCT